MIKQISVMFKLLIVAAVVIGGYGVYQTMTTDQRPRHGARVTILLPGGNLGNMVPQREIHVTIRVGGRWEVRDKKIEGTPETWVVQVPEGDRVHVEATESQERWAFLTILCTIHNDMGHLLDNNSGWGRVTCESLV